MSLMIQGHISEALQKYQLAIQRLSDNIQVTTAGRSDDQGNDYQFRIVILKATLVSNQAMCLLKQFNIKQQESIDSEIMNSFLGILPDMDEALQSMDHLGGSCPTEDVSNTRKTVRSKLLYRRSKVNFLLAVHGKTNRNQSHSQWIQHVSKAQSDLQELLSFDPDNKEAISFLRQVKSKTGEMIRDENISSHSSPLSSALIHLQEIYGKGDADPKSRVKNFSSDDVVGFVESLKYIHATLLDDLSNGTRELLRNDAMGGKLVLDIALGGGGKDDGVVVPVVGGINDVKEGPPPQVQTLAMQCVASACIHSLFSTWLMQYIQERMKEKDFEDDLYRIVSMSDNSKHDSSATDLVTAAMTLVMRLIIHKHIKEDDDCYNNASDMDESKSDECLNQNSRRMPSSNLQNRLCCRALESNQKQYKLMALNLLSIWLDQNPLNIINSAKENNNEIVYSKVKEPSENEIRKMAPRQLAEYRKRVAMRNRYRQQRSRNNAIYFCVHGGLDVLISKGVHSKESFWRRECIVHIGRLIKCVYDEATPFDDDGVPVDYVLQKIVRGVFEQIPEQDNIKEICELDEIHDNKLILGMKKCLFATAILYGVPSLGAWILNKAWKNAKSEWTLLASSDNVVIAMSIAADFASAAANEKETRSWISSSVDVGSVDGIWRKLLYCNDHDVQSGAASAMAKLGLSDKSLSSDEGELISLLQVATGLLQEQEEHEATKDSFDGLQLARPDNYNASFERGVELLSYLASKTFVKNEIIHGAGIASSSTPSEISVLEKLVQLTQSKSTISQPLKYSVANIFASLCVSVETVRREAFESQEITPEQYDELQAIGKTEEERKIDELKRDIDSSDAVSSRIKVMARYDVPQALVNLIAGATEGTLDQVVKSFSRIACEESVRGSMIQQGCLTACINLSKSVSIQGNKLL
jgi:hypothetical protein